KNAAALERAEKMDVLVVDKTGTLTIGEPVVTGVYAVSGILDRDLLRIAMSLEQGATHPLARAIVARASALGLSPLAVENVRIDAGRGVTGAYAQDTIRLGSPAFLAAAGVTIDEAARADAHAAGPPVVGVARSSTLLGWLTLADALRPNAASAVAALKSAGIAV